MVRDQSCSFQSSGMRYEPIWLSIARLRWGANVRPTMSVALSEDVNRLSGPSEVFYGLLLSHVFTVNRRCILAAKKRHESIEFGGQPFAVLTPMKARLVTGPSS